MAWQQDGDRIWCQGRWLTEDVEKGITGTAEISEAEVILKLYV